jgi:18S rRNA (guanine1575-N7)-methyltransferase
MTRKNSLPKFPDSYIGEEAEEYDKLRWMERNQKTTTLRCIEYLFDEKLGEIDSQSEDRCFILDLGCGTGYSSEILIENGFRVIGVDILEDMILKASKKKKERNYINLDLILADINNLPFRHNSFDHAVSISAYNFITHEIFDQMEKKQRVDDTARDLCKFLRKNGRLIIEFYPQDDKELKLFNSSFIKNGFDGFMLKENPYQKSGQTFLLLRKSEDK